MSLPLKQSRAIAALAQHLYDDLPGSGHSSWKGHVSFKTVATNVGVGQVGIVGYEINFNRYLYEYRPPRPLEEIEADIQAVEKEIVAMLREVAGA